MICNNCGKELTSNNNFCTHCGSRIDVPPVATSTNTSPNLQTSARKQVPRVKKRLMIQPRTVRVSKYDPAFYITFIGVFLLAIDFFNLFIISVIISGFGVFMRATDDNRVAYRRTDRPSTLWISLIYPIVTMIFLQQFNPNVIMAFIGTIILTYFLTPPSEVFALEDNRIKEIPKEKVKVSGGVFLAFTAIGFFIAIAAPLLGFFVYLIGVAEHVATLNKNAIKITYGDEHPAHTPYKPKIIATATASAPTTTYKPLKLSSIKSSSISELKSAYDRLIFELENSEKVLNRSVDGLEAFLSTSTPAIEERYNYLKTLDTSSLNDEISAIRRLQNEINGFQSNLTDSTARVNYLIDVSIPLEKDEVLPYLNQEQEMVKSYQINLDEVETRLKKLDFEPLQSKISDIKQRCQSLIDQYNQQIEQTRQEKKRIEEAKFETQAFKLKSVVSERRLSNLFAYFGVLFIVSGIIYGLNYSYLHYILPIFPSDVEQNTAIQGIVLIYAFGAFLGFVTPLILNKFVKLPRWGYNLFYSIGFLVFQIGFFVQKFYFSNANLSDGGYILWGLAICGILTVLANFFRSNLLGLTLAEFGAWFIYQIGIQEVSQDYIISIVSLILLGLLFINTLKKGLWMPFWGFGLFILPIWYVVQTNTGFVYLPEILALVLAISNVYLSLADKLQVEKTFGHFAVTIFLILPNAFSIYYAILNVSETLDETMRQVIIITVFGAFFILYWVFLAGEGELSISIKVPVGYKFSEEQLRMKSIYQRLNWMMLTSIAILIVAAVNLSDNDVYRPILYFALLLACMAIISIRKGFEKLVENSVFIIVLCSELFFIMSEFNVEIDTWTMIPYGLFLTTFAFIFLELLKSKTSTYKMIVGNQPTKILAYLVGFINLYNFTSASLSDYMIQVELFMICVWFVIMFLVSHLPQRNMSGNGIHQIPAFITPIALFIVGVLHQSTRFGIESPMDHIILNLPLLLLLFGSYFMVLGRKLELPLNPELTETPGKYLNPKRLYYPQISLLALPTIIMIYGKPYFYWPMENQAYLIAYIIVYFLTIPLLAILSANSEKDNFSINSGLASFYSIILSIVFLGGAKTIYDWLTEVNTRFDPSLLLIPIEIATYLFILIFVASIFWIMQLSKRVVDHQLPTNTQTEAAP